MNLDQEKLVEDVAAYSKMWMDFTTRMMMAGMNVNPKAPPQKMAEEFRKGVLGVVAEYSEAVMRSPQFLEMMKQSMDGVLAARKQFDEAMTSIRHDTQGTSRQDIDSLMMTIRHMGTRLSDRLDQLEERLNSPNGQAGPAATPPESSGELATALERITERLDHVAARLDALDANRGSENGADDAPERTPRAKRRAANKSGGTAQE